jgi:hypothetical protein
VHESNAQRLEKIIDAFGWPGASLVGEDGAEAAWLILQHAISKPILQRRCLPLLQRAAEQGQALWKQYAMLLDRIRFNERKPQVYGTQFDWDKDGQMSPWPMEDPNRHQTFRLGKRL